MTDAAEKRVCAHCLSEVPIEKWTLEDGKWFCCHGCRLAYAILNSAGLGDFYRRRKWEETGLPEGAFETRYTDEELERYTIRRDGGTEIALLVEGVRCSSCVWVLENLLLNKPGVLGARVSFSSRSARVFYDPARIKPSAVLEVAASVGYPARPFEPGESEASAEKERMNLLIRFGTAAFLSMQLMGASIGLYGGFIRGMERDSHQYLGWFAFFLATPVVFWCGWPFITGAVRSIRNRSADMDLLVTLGVFSSYFYSIWALLGEGEVYFDSSAAIVTFVLLGRLVEAGARVRSVSGITRLLKLKPDRARLVTDGKTLEVDANSLRSGNLISVRPGDRFPADGFVEEGESETDASSVTGEPYPEAVRPGSKVLSGTVNLTGVVLVRVTAAGSDAFISRIARLVSEAEARKPDLARFGDRVSAVFVPVVIALAIFAGAAALAMGLDARETLSRAVAVLVVACPCALGLATPLAVAAASARAGSAGIIFRGGDIFEKVAAADTVAFDKTGTLTQGKPTINRITIFSGSEDSLLKHAAEAEAGSSHPIAKSIIAEARKRGIEPRGARSRAVPGRGVVCQTEGGVVRVGALEWLLSEGVKRPLGELPPGCGVEVWVALEDKIAGRIELSDEERPESKSALGALAALGMKTVMLTGDRRSEAERMGARLGLTEMHACLLPEEKAEFIRREKEKGRRVIMVGDGINDAAALAEADVGSAFAGSTDVALDTSDLVFLRPDLRQIASSVELSKRTVRIIKENLWWAFGYNGIALVLAATGVLAPLYAALAMAGSSVTVVLNSLRITGTRM